MSFLSPLLWALFIGWFGATYWGIIGITIVLALGLFLLLLVKLPRHTRVALAPGRPRRGRDANSDTLTRGSSDRCE